MEPAHYYRASKNWNTDIGKRGVVVFETKLEVTSPELEQFLPYSFLIISFSDGTKREVVGEAQTEFAIGDIIVLELRKAAIPQPRQIIPYTLKAVKVIP